MQCSWCQVEKKSFVKTFAVFNTKQFALNRIYVDSVFNHMAANQAEKIANGTGNSWAVPENRMYPAVPYDSSNFHPPCALVDYNDAYQVRNCELVGLHDLNQTVEDTRNKIVNYLNYMIDLGVAGFRIDAAKHQWPNDLEIIYNRLKKLNTSFGFAENSDPFIYQEVIDTGNEAVSKYEYIFAVVTEFRYSSEIGRSFTGNDDLKWLQSFGEKWDLLPSHLAMTFIDDHDSQRSGGDGILTYKKRKNYIMAQAFSLAHPYGHKRIMSSFNFDNNDQGPPTDKHENILTPSIDATGNCVNGWVCEHRFHAIYSMVEFMNTVATEPISDWWDNDKNQIAFSRGSKGFVAFNLDKRDMSNVTIITPMAPGVYCDIISGQLLNNKCTGKQLEVSSVHTITINLPNDDPNGVVAIHAGHQVTKNSYNRNSWRRKPIKKNIIPEVIKAPIQNN